MATSAWSSIQTGGGTTADPAAMLNSQLASALSTMGDAQYWEESISPASIRQSLGTADPSNAHSTPVLLKGMKWLLACISKGRNVSDFYPHVVKLVGSHSLEVRKMVYMYLVQYADHDASTRELSLLSINSFQRGLADNEQLIRALALRVMSSIRVADVMQIQILAVQKAASDKSPYVRKCAANALAKLSPRCDAEQKNMLLEIMQSLLHNDHSTMVLTSTIVAFTELCPDRLELLHSCFRKLCDLLTDMDEWGQILVLETMARYCRTHFAKPSVTGTAERIDRERRVRRTVSGIAQSHECTVATATAKTNPLKLETLPSLPTPGKKIKRRVVKKGFYSDEEDGSTEEEVFVGVNGNLSSSVVGALRQTGVNGTGAGPSNMEMEADEDSELHEDHRLLLRSSLPLLKSRNSGVVLAVCSLQYYCGVASIKVRSSLGKALVRIHRDRREIQYVVLTSIKTLVNECPSAFAPYLNDFFVKAMDPSFTRMIKLDILTSLALEPASIEAVLKELRNYIRHDDTFFACAAIRAVGKVVELARIVHDRHGEKSGQHPAKERHMANQTALNSLYGLMTLTLASTDDWIVGECVTVMQRIMQQLQADHAPVDDPNHVQELSLKRLVVLLIMCLSSRTESEDDDEEDEEKVKEEGKKLHLPPTGVASSMWIVAEWLAPSSTTTISDIDDGTKTRVRVELLRLIAKCFPDMDSIEKIQGIHFASKVLVHGSGSTNEAAICELILSMGRTDVKTDVRDRARYESALLHAAVGLKQDLDALPPDLGSSSCMKLSVDKAKNTLLQNKPPPSALPLEEESNETEGSSEPLRFGTLSSLVGYRARAAYLVMPKWAEVDSDGALREPVVEGSKKTANGVGGISVAVEKVDYGWKVQKNKTSKGFYDSDDESTDDSEDSSSSSEDSSSMKSSSSSSSDDDDSDEVPDSKRQVVALPSRVVGNGGGPSKPPSSKAVSLVDVSSEEAESDDESDSSDDSDDDDDSEDDDAPPLLPTPSVGILLNMSVTQHPPLMAPKPLVKPESNNTSSYANGLEGLVMAPIVVEEIVTEEKPDLERDSSEWVCMVRPELGGGLAVMVRYLRGPTKAREAKLMGFTSPDAASTMAMQFRFENRRTDGGMLRRIRLHQHKSVGATKTTTTVPTIAPRRMVLPPEISILTTGQMSILVVGVDFACASDKEGAMHGKLEVKSDRGSNVLDIRPPLGELLQRVKLSKSEFEASMQRLQGFNRVTSSFTCTGGEHGRASLIEKILKRAALTALNKDMKWKDNKFHFAGQLPVSVDKVFVVVTVDDFSRGELLVCCDNALAINSLLDLVKKALVG